MAASPYDAYKAGMFQAAANDAAESLDAAFVRFVSLWGANGRDVSDHPLWPLLNAAQRDMAEIRRLASEIAQAAMSGTLDNIAQS